jgi:hypothetical protein
MFSRKITARFGVNIPPLSTGRSRPIVVCGILAMLAFAVPSSRPAHAGWCATYRNGGNNCGFANFAQCQAAVSGVGGFCASDGSPDAKPARREREAAPRPKRKEKERERAAPAERTIPPPSPAAVAAPVPARPVPVPATPAPAQVVAPAPVAAPPADGAFAQARQLILSGQFDAGLAAMRALGFDDHPDIATYIGFAYRKLGRIEEAKSWYGRALTADPNHKLALSFYGMLRADEGDIPGAQANLVRIGQLCGNINCNEYQALQGVIAAKIR